MLLAAKPQLMLSLFAVQFSKEKYILDSSPEKLHKELEEELKLSSTDLRSHAWYHGRIPREVRMGRAGAAWVCHRDTPGAPSRDEGDALNNSPGGASTPIHHYSQRGRV